MPKKRNSIEIIRSRERQKSRDEHAQNQAGRQRFHRQQRISARHPDHARHGYTRQAQALRPGFHFRTANGIPDPHPRKNNQTRCLHRRNQRP